MWGCRWKGFCSSSIVALQGPSRSLSAPIAGNIMWIKYQDIHPHIERNNIVDKQSRHHLHHTHPPHHKTFQSPLKNTDTTETQFVIKYRDKKMDPCGDIFHLFWYLSISVHVAAFHDGLGKISQVCRVVVLTKSLL